MNNTTLPEACKNQCVWPNCHCLDAPEQSGNSGELKADLRNHYLTTGKDPLQIEEVKPNWDKEADNYSLGVMWKNEDVGIIDNFKAGCNHVYETVVKPMHKEIITLKERHEEVKDVFDMIAAGSKSNYESKIAALKEEKAHFHKLYVEQLNRNVELRAKIENGI